MSIDTLSNLKIETLLGFSNEEVTLTKNLLEGVQAKAECQVQINDSLKAFSSNKRKKWDGSWEGDMRIKR